MIKSERCASALGPWFAPEPDSASSCGSSLAGSLVLNTGTLVSHVTLRLLKPECALDKSWCQEELSVAVKRAVTLLHSHTVTSRVGKGEPGKGQEGQRP